MSLTSVNAELLKAAFLAGANNLSNNKEYINELNVFPVPDGDTRTNMTLTIMAAAYEVEAVAKPTMDLLSKAISGGSLRGARGNSGVILSQLFRGFCRDIKGKDTLDVNDITAAFARAVETAYKAVMKPKEGTILTVAKGIYDKAAELCDYEDDVVCFMEQVVEHGDMVLQWIPADRDSWSSSEVFLRESRARRSSLRTAHLPSLQEAWDFLKRFRADLREAAATPFPQQILSSVTVPNSSYCLIRNLPISR